jgi:hypothetical protein
MSRNIRNHTVFGKAYMVKGKTEDEVRQNIKSQVNMWDKHIWEFKWIDEETCEAYVAKHGDCFADNH